MLAMNILKLRWKFLGKNKKITMTRINCGIQPAELSREHLIAEHREIKRIPNCVSKGRFSLKGQPSEFKLGPGHVKFFYTRLGYLKKRYEDLYKECLRRKYDVTYFGDAWNDIPPEYMNDYVPTKKDIEIVKQRIKERIDDSRRSKKNGGSKKKRAVS